MPWHLTITVDRDVDVPLTDQIKSGIQRGITEGALRPGTRLPSTRQLAIDLGVSRTVTLLAYEQLTAEGYLTALQGSGTRVAETPAARILRTPGRVEEKNAPVQWDLRVGQPDTANFPLRDWLVCYRRVLAGAAGRDLDVPPLGGAQNLQETLAGYLGRMRGIRVTKESRLLVTSGVTQSVSAVCELLNALGIRELAVEDPGHKSCWQTMRDAGIRPRPVPVDRHGLDVQALSRMDVRAVLVTPTHQFPTGVALGGARKEALMRWAAHDARIVIEHDCGGEFWYERRTRQTALQPLLPERVIYMGCVGGSLLPGIRIGWLALPARLVPMVNRPWSRWEFGPDPLTQLAFAEMVGSGLFDRHVRRLRSRYRERADAVREAVRHYLPRCAMLGSTSGRTLYVGLPAAVDEAALVESARRRSVLVQGGSHFHFDGTSRSPALVLGYQNLPRTGIRASVSAIREALDEQMPAAE
ncbi:MocR-like pyridoxine biosynthesis transcription factor PdxR [Streptomyces xantholiticus]|uniref:MocR-like pyridoxine biosynthesis transcription factor PdxR n=1 Tax=Streptomyces xantholiticus TaxID=68285 RepID=UPI001675B5F8|nr:PLP-dependent aminotransferase family protein [Streptomyces xantholiticus]GGW49109.1 GntR family transcriptional regulator [Streptomyces xantholiticus]